MNARYIKLVASAMGLFLLLLSARQAQAQSSFRTFVSGLGSDSNPCTRALPCQTMVAAIANTFSGGEVYILDAAEVSPGGGFPIITKSVSIIGAGGRGGITGGFSVAPPAGGQVVLKGLDIDAVGGVGISVTSSAGLSLVIDDCTIFNGGTGINFTPQPSTATSYLVVRNSTIYNNKASQSGFAGGIIVQPGSTGPSVVVLDGVHLDGNYYGVVAFDYTNMTIRNSVISQSVWAGIRAQSNAGGAVTIFAEHSQSSHNGGNGVIAVGTGATLRLHDVTSTDNPNGLITNVGGVIISFGDNAVGGNVNDGTPTFTVPLR